LWEAAARFAADGVAAALATVSRHRGSLPMSTNAKMLVTREGRKMGTVGGGCVEADVIQQAIEAIERGRPAFVQHTLNADVAGDLGLSCGGTVQLFLEPVLAGPAMAELCMHVADGIRTRERVAVFTGIEWAGGPRKAARVGQRTLNAAGNGTLPADEDTWARDGNTFLDESRSLFVERMPRVPRVVVCGAGHVGVEIARAAARAGFHVVVADDREDFANAERIPDAHQIIVGDFSRLFDGFRVDEDDYVLATTRGHSYDAIVVERAAQTPAKYVGMLGSRRKKAVIWKALQEAGVPAHALQRVHCPIGLEIGADDPAEIAISVVAELIRCRRVGELLQQTPQ
jgi:xanthine dehydrogenase accessory factor